MAPQEDLIFAINKLSSSGVGEAVHGPVVPSIHSRRHNSRWEARQLRKADPIWAFHMALLKATVEKSTKLRLLTVLQLVSEMYLPMKLFTGCRVFPSSSQTVSTKVRREKDTALAQLPSRLCFLQLGSGPRLPGTRANFQGCFIAFTLCPLTWRTKGHLVL